MALIKVLDTNWNHSKRMERYTPYKKLYWFIDGAIKIKLNQVK